MRKYIVMALTVMMVLGLMGGVAGAFPEETVGQPADHEGTVTGVVFHDAEGEGWYLIMPYRGDFGDGSYLIDGWIINVYTDRNGNAFVFIFVSEDDPRYTGENALWNTWDAFLRIRGGSAWQENSGRYMSNR